MITSATIITILCTVVGSSGMFAFIQFLISRKDKRDDKLDELKEDIQVINDSIQDVRNDIDAVKTEFSTRLAFVRDEMERGQAIQCRIRILRANDEMRQHTHHSYEYFRQLHSDITEYENYCLMHPEFKNNEAVNSIEYINKVYQKCLSDNDFLI